MIALLVAYIFAGGVLSTTNRLLPTPSWYGSYSYCRGYAYIADSISHVSAIEFSLGTDESFFGVVVYGDGVSRTPAPTCGCTLSVGHTLTLQTGERILNLDFWSKNHPANSGLKRWYKATFTLNTGAVVNYEVPQSAPLVSPTKHTWTTPAGQEFVGFDLLGGASSGCCIDEFWAYFRVYCTVTLSILSGDSSSSIFDPTKTRAFTVTASPLCGALEYQVSYSPASATPNLITLSSSTPTTI
jgi:hypothetical protein